MKLHARAGYSNSSKVKRDIEEAAKEVTKYIVDLTNGIWVTPKDARPDSQGNPTAKTKGWRIRDSIEAFIGETMLAKISTGAITFFNDSAKKLMELTTGALRFYDGTDEANPVAEFGEAAARLGKETGKNTFVDTDGMHVRNGKTVLSEFTGKGASIGKNDVEAVLDLCNGEIELYGLKETINDADNYGLHIRNVGGNTQSILDQLAKRAITLLAGNTASIQFGYFELYQYYSHWYHSDGSGSVGIELEPDAGTMYCQAKSKGASHAGAAVLDFKNVVIPNPTGMFAVTSHKVHDGNIAAEGYQSGTANLKKENYYPLCVCGWNSATRYYCLTRSQLSDCAVGSANLKWMVFNASSNAHNSSLTIDILWLNAADYLKVNAGGASSGGGTEIPGEIED